jgi:hypothetical protein
MSARARAADHHRMEPVARLIDGDLRSLELRVSRALALDAGDCRVARFTYWYTGRPPVYEAILLRPEAPEG